MPKDFLQDKKSEKGRGRLNDMSEFSWYTFPLTFPNTANSHTHLHTHVQRHSRYAPYGCFLTGEEVKWRYP